MSKNPNGGGIPLTPDPVLSDPSVITLDPEVEELWSSRALLLVLLLRILSFWVSYYLKVRRIRSVHETIVALFAGQSSRTVSPESQTQFLSLGMFVGIVVRLSPGNVIQNMVSFKSTILLNVLLPPIILNSGYQLKQVSPALNPTLYHPFTHSPLEIPGKLLSKFWNDLNLRLCWNLHLCCRIRVRYPFVLLYIDAY